MILVTGATGTVGRVVVDLLCAAGVPVRAVTRRPETAGLPGGVEVVRADLGEPRELGTVLAGVERVFLVSSGPEIPRHDANLAKAAAAAGVAHIVKLSSGRVGDETATDPIPQWHRAGERAVRDSGVAWTMLRPLGFMANALHWARTVREQDTVYAPYGRGRIAVIDTEDIAAVAATVLTQPGHEGRTYTLSGPEPLSAADQTAILAETLGRPLRFVETTPDQARATLIATGMPADMADAVMALRAGALASFTSVIHPDVQRITSRPPRNFRSWTQTHRAEFE
ncbi:SDR family oxidoreductase [Nocardia terpenica]|uniref:SDR family oxidoreductase n=1 Tax=Nocardia terpenica TaxID=455432 RepID=UPI002FE2A2C4